MQHRSLVLKALWCGLLSTTLVASCSLIDEDLSDCGTDYTLDYELLLVTNMNVELQSTLTLSAEVNVKSALRTYLSTVFTDHAHDVELSFYDTKADSVKLHHDRHIMDANQRSYTLYIPRQKYMHLAVANIAGNPEVALTGDTHCHDALLTTDVSATQPDTVASQQTGLFTARRLMDIQEEADQTFGVNLYMANAAAALVVDPAGNDASGLRVFTTGFATAFSIADSTYRFADKAPLVRTVPIATGDTMQCFCSVTFPSADSGAPTRSGQTIIEPDSIAVVPTDTVALWQVRVYAPRPDGSTTESILAVREPLRAGHLKVLRCRLAADGRIETDDDRVGVSVTLNWNDGGHHSIVF